MGGCMSSPKDLKEGEAPVEPITPKVADGETVAQEEVKEGGENEVEKKEEPSVETSEPAAEAKPEEAEAAPAETKKEEIKPEEAPVEKDKSDEPLVTL